MQSVTKVLVGASTPHFGVYVPPTQEKVNKIKILRDQFQQEWKMLQCSGKLSVFIFSSYQYMQVSEKMIKYSWIL